MKALRGQKDAEASFRHLMVEIMTYVLGKLSGKGVFHNTLLFAGRMLAFAFFRIEGIAFQLLAALPTKPIVLMRFARASREYSASDNGIDQVAYPEHLRQLQFDNSRQYINRITSYVPDYATYEEDEAFHFKSGNWLRRWQSDDSELFPAFYKAYHRNLATYMADAIQSAEARGTTLPASVLMSAPGYAHLAAVYATKTHSYIVGAVNAVTTTSAATSFTADESLGLRGNAKPPVLETANRRLTEIILNLANSHIFVQTKNGSVLECEGAELWSSMIDIWVKYLISRTSLYSPRGVFCLFDLLDGVVTPPYDPIANPVMDAKALLESSLMDIPHLVSVLRLVLTETDHHLTLAKCITFIWTHYDTICANVKHREALCINLLLDHEIFERLMLFWSQSVRSYVLRLVVFRLGHVSTTPEDSANHEMEVTTVQLLNTRLERIRRRHNELEPKDLLATPSASANQLEGEESSDNKIKKSASTITMVEAADRANDSQATTAERLLGLGGSTSPSMSAEGAEPEFIAVKGKGKASSWFKKPFGKQKKRKNEPETESDVQKANRLKPQQQPTKAAATLPRPSADLQPGQPDSPAALSHKSAGESIDSFEGDASALQPLGTNLPTISTTQAPRMTTPEPPVSPASPNRVQFEFELPTASPRSDAFDRVSSPRRTPSNPQRMPPSPSMSRSFSKRSSLLHPAAAGVLGQPASPSFRRSIVAAPEPPGYSPNLHPYCIRMLAELEDVEREVSRSVESQTHVTETMLTILT